MMLSSFFACPLFEIGFTDTAAADVEGERAGQESQIALAQPWTTFPNVPAAAAYLAGSTHSVLR